jgi:hypothetical protein
MRGEEDQVNNVLVTLNIYIYSIYIYRVRKHRKYISLKIKETGNYIQLIVIRTMYS